MDVIPGILLLPVIPLLPVMPSPRLSSEPTDPEGVEYPAG